MPPARGQPPRPDFAAGWRTRLPGRGWWTSEDPEEREAAKNACGSCPVLAECQRWVLAQSSY